MWQYLDACDCVPHEVSCCGTRVVLVAEVIMGGGNCIGTRVTRFVLCYSGQCHSVLALWKRLPNDHQLLSNLLLLHPPLQLCTHDQGCDWENISGMGLDIHFRGTMNPKAPKCAPAQGCKPKSSDSPIQIILLLLYSWPSDDHRYLQLQPYHHSVSSG